jgi:hypothetical protein
MITFSCFLPLFKNKGKTSKTGEGVCLYKDSGIFIVEHFSNSNGSSLESANNRKV